MSVQFFINNNRNCKLVSDNDEVIQKLNQLLSFHQPGAEYSPAFQNGYWNGIVKLIDNQNCFSLGLLDRVQDFLNEEKIDYQITDHRVAIKKSISSLNILPKLEALGKLPRPYQTAAIDTLIQYNRGIAKLATGAGKTLSMALLTATLNKPTLILVISLDLLEQFHSLFTQIFNEPIGRIGDGEITVGNFTIATLWTIARSIGIKPKEILDDDEGVKEQFDERNSEKIKHILRQAKVIIFDECHLASCTSLQKIYKETNAEYFYGFSATPQKDTEDAILVNAVFGEVKVNIAANQLIKQGYLVKPLIRFFPVPHNPEATGNYTSIYREYIVENPVRNNLIVDVAAQLSQNQYKTLILFRVINHGKLLFQMCQERGIRCGLLSGTDSLEQREEIKNQMNNGELDCIIASTIFDTGVDIPCLNALILGSGGKSSIKTLQRVGRILRPAPGKTHCKVIDFWDNAKYLKNHSKARIKIYKSEPGFEVIFPKPKL